MKTKLLILPLLILITLSSCLEKAKPKKPKIKKSDALITGNPINYGMEDVLMFPVGTAYKEIVYDDDMRDNKMKKPMNMKDNINFIANSGPGQWDRSAQKEFINNDENRFDIRNILFYDMKTGVTYPFLKDTLHILSFALHGEFKKSFIFYRIVKKDYNKDSIFNSQDPVMLYISDLYGKQLVQVTPSYEQFVDFTYYPPTETILVKTIIDSDKDKRFTSFDETNFREVNMNKPTIAREIFKKSLKDSLRKVLKTY